MAAGEQGPSEGLWLGLVAGVVLAVVGGVVSANDQELIGGIVVGLAGLVLFISGTALGVMLGMNAARKE